MPIDRVNRTSLQLCAAVADDVPAQVIGTSIAPLRAVRSVWSCSSSYRRVCALCCHSFLVVSDLHTACAALLHRIFYGLSAKVPFRCADDLVWLMYASPNVTLEQEQPLRLANVF
ncbi:hypothetical protein PHSY_001978 [Pseudozyma hubeiensis SY62]|uniref:Uncharacterized protein n=1 Tax=Pseudozyma hubeiensis (strain SY62) TaxID=1305764 RepID=R9P081_PSEHS|nr:hypothetical protein PHSY_001978 [Pseudozyma hubeiensis SY62]GAC94407.1 hypothetical protein PHSY_001978 [Pseudozyma hubeiensis SY62]